MTFSAAADRTLIRAEGASTRYLLASYTAPVAPRRADRLPVSVALVLDRSGSMAGERKFALARLAVEQALQLLRPTDRFSLVVYDERIDVLAPARAATAEAKGAALSALRRIEPRGSTDLHAGWSRGGTELADGLRLDGIARVLLLTDGLANHGETDPGVLAREAGSMRASGIATSTFGVGDDFDERLLRDMAHEGGGHFYFIEHPAQIADQLTSELGEALETTVRHAALQFVMPHGAAARSVNRFRSEHLAGTDRLRIELGDLVSGQEMRAVIAVDFPTGMIGADAVVELSLSGHEVHGTTPLEMPVRVAFTYASQDANDHQPRNVEVDRAVATLFAANARAEATEANRHHDFNAARRVLERTANRVASYAGDDTGLQSIARELREAVPEYADVVMDARALKSSFFQAEASVKGRSSEGRVRRRQ